jgi:transcriptional regulator
MHIPRQFQQNDIASLHALITANPLGTLVIAGPEGLSANHIPFELTVESEPYGSLLGHVARANPLWRGINGETEALVIFQGANSYISPSWYPSKQAHGKVVPTWNYAVVHAHGRIRAIDDSEWLRAHVTRLTNRQESAFDLPWRIEDAPVDYIENLLGAIVGIRIEITRLEGKWKVSQNRPAADREGVVSALRRQDSSAAQVMAGYVEEIDDKPST